MWGPDIDEPQPRNYPGWIGPLVVAAVVLLACIFAVGSIWQAIHGPDESFSLGDTSWIGPTLVGSGLVAGVVFCWAMFDIVQRMLRKQGLWLTLRDLLAVIGGLTVLGTMPFVWDFLANWAGR